MYLFVSEEKITNHQAAKQTEADAAPEVPIDNNDENAFEQGDVLLFASAADIENNFVHKEDQADSETNSTFGNNDKVLSNKDSHQQNDRHCVLPADHQPNSGEEYLHLGRDCEGAGQSYLWHEN